MRKNIGCMMAGIVILALTACGAASKEENTSMAESSVTETSSAAAGEHVTLKIGTHTPVGSPLEKNSLTFGEKLAELSGGTMTVDVVAGGALGNIPQHFSQLSSGTLDIYTTGVDAPMAVQGGKDFNIFGLPFLFDDVEHYHKFLTSDVYQEMVNSVEQENHIKYIGALGDRSPRALSTKNKAVRTPEDMKGIVIRVPEANIPITIFQARGANTATSSGSGIFEGLQTGMFDGQDNGADAMVSNGYMEIQKYYMPLDHTQQGITMWMSGKTWEKLSAEQQEWVLEAADYTDRTANENLWNVEMPAYYDAMKEAGMGIVEDIDFEAFQAIVDQKVPELEGKEFGEGLYSRIRSLR